MEIIVYSSSNCGYCHQQKEFLQGNGFVFEERDIAKEEYLQELKSLGGNGTPFTLIQEGTEIISKVSGFNKAELIKILITKQGEINMEKNHNEENATVNEVEAKATVTATLRKGDASATSERVNLTTGFAKVTAQNTSGGIGVVVVQIMDPTIIDEAIHTWRLKAGETLNTSTVRIERKDTYYLRLTSMYSGTGTGSLSPSTIIA